MNDFLGIPAILHTTFILELQIMDKLLDKEVHQLYKAPSLTTYLTGAQQAAAQQGRMLAANMGTASGSHHGGAKVSHDPSESQQHKGSKEGASGGGASAEAAADKNAQ